MKTITAMSILGIAYIHPETTILAIVIGMFLLHITSKVIEKRNNNQNSNSVENAYQASKDLFNNKDSNIYLQDKPRKKTSALKTKQEIRKYISGLPESFTDIGYRDIQQICRQLNINNINRKRGVLIEEIQKIAT